MVSSQSVVLPTGQGRLVAERRAPEIKEPTTTGAVRWLMKNLRFLISICATFGVLLRVVTFANAAEVAYHFDRNAFAATARAAR